MRPALEHASSIWSPLASSTSINKLPVMQIAELRTQDVHKTQTYNICMTKHSYYPYTSTYSSTRHITNQQTQYPTNTLHNHTTYFNTPRLKPTIINNGCYITNIPTDPHTVTTTGIKISMRHIHTSFVSRHLTTRDINKILHTPPPHISSSEEILPASSVAPLPNSEQINHPSSNHT